ncbi:MAG: LacI family DNA-binding transcriptional regulator [Bacteroidota bacterium]
MGATLDDIAKKVGVSKTTVYRALNSKSRISEKTRELILKTAKELKYVPNTLASGLRSKRSMVIGLIFSDLIAAHFYAEIFHGIEDVATRNNYGVIFACSNGRIEKETKLLTLFSERQVDGIIVAPTWGIDINCYLRLKDQRIPFIFIDKSLDNITTDIVTTDDFTGGIEATEYLIGLGHQKIAILLGPEYPCSTIEKRIEGYRHALKSNGLKYEKIINLHKNIQNQKEYGYLAIQNYLDQAEHDATAFFAINDSLAIGAIKAFRERGFKIPEDVSIIGYNNDEIDRFFDVQLTTVSQPKYEMGRKAMELLLQRINHRNESEADDNYYYINMKPELIIRESCGENPGKGIIS